MDASTLIGSLGVTSLLVAFFLNLIKHLPQDSMGYIVLNMVGAGLIERVGSRYQLYDDPLVRSYLKVLAETFDDSMTHQQILAQVQNTLFYPFLGKPIDRVIWFFMRKPCIIR